MNIIARTNIQRERLLNDDNTKVKLMIDIPGTAKTTSAIEYCLNNNKNNIIFFNNHKLTFDFYQDINYNFILRNPDKLVNIFHGKFKQLTEMEKIIFNFSRSSPCNLSDENERLFECIKNGFGPSKYCRSYCKFYSICQYQYMLKDNYNSIRNIQNVSNYNIMNLMTKSHVHTKLTEKMLEDYNRFNIIMDENFFNILYEQINISFYHLKNYKKTLLNVISYDNSLNNLWKDLSNIIDRICDFIVGFKSYKIKLKKEKIIDEFEDFLDSYSINDIEQWNLLMSLTTIDNINNIDIKSNNLTKYFTRIFEFIIECKKNNINASDQMVLDLDDELFSFVIDKKNDLIDLINKSNKFIITSSLIDEEIFKRLFPSLINDYVVIKNSTIKPKFKEVWRYTRGVYPKYYLWKKKLPTSQFNNLVKITADILDRHKFEKVLILAFKDFIYNRATGINFIESGLKRILKNYDSMEIYYDYWYGLEGLNRYNDCDVEIQFGTPGIPKSNIKSMSYALNIDKHVLDRIFTFGEQIQGSERLRSFLHPNKKIIYQLSKLKNGYYHSYIDFSSIIEKEYSSLIDFISKCGVADTKKITTIYFKNKKSIRYVRNILDKLLSQGVLIRYERRNNLGRPKYLWRVK